GRSQGEHDHGAGELDDARLLLNWLCSRYPELPYSLAGFSFGSRIALRLGCSDRGARRLIAVGLPTGSSELGYLKSCFVSKYFIHSRNDEHGPMEVLERLYLDFAEPKQIHWIEAADLFFLNGLDVFEETVYTLSR